MNDTIEHSPWDDSTEGSSFPPPRISRRMESVRLATDTISASTEQTIAIMSEDMRPMTFSEWISLVSLAVSIIALLVSIGGNKALPRIRVSEDVSDVTTERKYILRLENAGLGAMLDVRLKPDSCLDSTFTPRIDSGGRWETMLHVGEDSDDFWIKDAPPRLEPLDDRLPKRLILSWRSAPFGLIRHRKGIRLKQVGRFLSEA
ncbi:hypothetical protein [Bifidobacterium sp. SO1]|uniref:hypothetical protein n=1 Tax=Bifidobacterium sp. SO1 TaxID=2809029 RepID=UPI001BDCD08E|nr:hypothetical protein [Bifidobacterium sp. SO1]MBT1161791.1 hypothetical protein [Bifidobacterium sp. SO1]